MKSLKELGQLWSAADGDGWGFLWGANLARPLSPTLARTTSLFSA